MKTEQEKIAMCILFLQKRGYGVCKPKLKVTEVAAFLSVSGSAISNWTNVGSKYYKPDFPKPRGCRTSAGLHFDAQEIAEWANKHCEKA